MKYDVIIVGSGFAGATLANKFANDNKKVLIIEKRPHIGGNMYEDTRKNGVRVHLYGPHIFHTNDEEVFNYLKQFTNFYFYEHRVLANINNTLVPVPFNFKSIELLFDGKTAEQIKTKLKTKYPDQKKVSILDLINDKDKEIKKFGEFVFENIFVHYTAKQWNTSIENVDKSVINRVPVLLGYDDRYFQDQFQYMPKNGYNEIFENMLKSKKITTLLNTNANKLIKVDTENNKVYYDGKEFKGKLIYTGEIDELLGYKYGPLPYRSLKLKFEDKKEDFYQPVSVVNYTVSEEFTRITEFKYLSNQTSAKNTTILKEYPLTYNYKDKKQTPYYAIFNEDNLNLYNKYLDDLKNVNNIYLCGRLAEYKYYNMDAVVRRALDLYETIK
jgi:UDP-galactopyranose mutase